MNKTANWIVGGLAVVALIVGVVAYNKSPSSIVGSVGPQGPQGERGLQGPTGPQGPQGVKGATGSQSELVGSVTGPDFYSPYFNINDVKGWYYSSGAIEASTSCMFKSPNATTTVVSFTASYSRLASSTVVELGQSASTNATTTLLARQSLGTGGGNIIATTTATALTDGVVPGNTYLSVKVGGGDTKGTNTPIGKCKLTLREI